MAPGVQPNRALVRGIRERLSWTQERLAGEAGLSVRVVAKLESGGAVSRATLGKVASAFGRAGASVGTADLMFSANRVLKQFVMNCSEVSESVHRAWRTQLASDASLTIAGAKPWMPLAGTHAGAARVADAWARFLALFDNRDTDWAPDRRIAKTGDGALVWGLWTIRDCPNSTPCLLLVRIRAKEGLVIYLEAIFDEVGVRARLSGSRPP